MKPAAAPLSNRARLCRETEPPLFIRDPNSVLTNWTYYASPSRNNGVSVVLTPGAATGSGFSDFHVYNWKLWDSSNGGTGTIPINPPSGANNVWASDSALENQATLGQSISGLVAGRTYEVGFNWAAAQLRFPDGSLWNGPTTDYWSVNLGGTIVGDNLVGGGTAQDTSVISLASHDFSGWQSAKMRFVATSAVENLFFTSIGTPPSGAPPLAMLDGVTMSAVPEASTWAMLIAGFGLVGAAARRRRLVAA